MAELAVLADRSIADGLTTKWSPVQLAVWRSQARQPQAGCPLVMESHGIYEDHFPALESHGK